MRLAEGLYVQREREQLLWRLVLLVVGGEYDEGLDNLVASRVGRGDDGGLENGGVLLERALRLERSDAVSGTADNVVVSPGLSVSV